MAGGVTGRPAPAGRRSALLVANAAYRDPGLSRLRSPVPDIRALADVLGAPAIGAFEVDTLTDADEAVLRRRVAAFFADRGPDDVLLLHFSCHGLKDQRGRRYLAAADTELSALAATGLPASFVSEQMGESASRSVLLVLDCCYSGAFAHDTAVRADRSVHIADAFRGGGTGRVVLTASSATEYSFEGGRITSYEAQPSVFTEALVRGLRTGAADLDHDGEISVDELFEHASQRVREAQVGQVPRKWAYESTGPLVVARSVRPAVLPDEIRSDLASDRRVLRLEAVRALADLGSLPRTKMIYILPVWPRRCVNPPSGSSPLWLPRRGMGTG
ncbi:caspase family protein [Actinoplanes subtropicus]|uniref:caspase family protein n=1 Tax=Actinoplanes subtropicus TaxID=543632 RepID=UPI00068CB309|nr:caspase family protein [Actinoplanes subtropicus]